MIFFTYLWTPIHRCDGSLHVHVLLENELLRDFVTFLFLAGCSLFI